MTGGITMEKFSTRLKIALDQNNMKPIDLAKKANLSRGVISQYLSDKIVPKSDKVYLFAKILKVSPAWLMGFDEPDYIIKDDVLIEKIDKLSPSSKEALKKYVEFLYMSEHNMFTEKEDGNV